MTEYVFIPMGKYIFCERIFLNEDRIKDQNSDPLKLFKDEIKPRENNHDQTKYFKILSFSKNVSYEFHKDDIIIAEVFNEFYDKRFGKNRVVIHENSVLGKVRLLASEEK